MVKVGTWRRIVQVVHKIIYIDLSDFSEFITAVKKLGWSFLGARVGKDMKSVCEATSINKQHVDVLLLPLKKDDVRHLNVISECHMSHMVSNVHQKGFLDGSWYNSTYTGHFPPPPCRNTFIFQTCISRCKLDVAAGIQRAHLNLEMTSTNWSRINEVPPNAFGCRKAVGTGQTRITVALIKWKRIGMQLVTLYIVDDDWLLISIHYRLLISFDCCGDAFLTVSVSSIYRTPWNWHFLGTHTRTESWNLLASNNDLSQPHSSMVVSELW